MPNTVMLYSFRNENELEWLHTTDFDVLKKIVLQTYIAKVYQILINENRILLSETICSNLNKFGKSLSEIYHKTCILLEKYPNINKQIVAINSKDSNFSKFRNEVNNLFNKETLQIQKDLEANFRTILGVI